MNTDEKLYEEKEKRLIDEIEKKHGKSVDQLRQEREKRVIDAMNLKEPDRVPVDVWGTASRICNDLYFKIAEDQGLSLTDDTK